MLRDAGVITAINELWRPVYPYMAAHLLDLFPEPPHTLLEVGPFSGGVALAVLRKASGCRATVLDETDAVPAWVRQEAMGEGTADRLTTRPATFVPLPETDASFDLVAVRGAFFFLTPSLLEEIGRVLRPGGFAWVGGGYGPLTPDSVIAPIADESRRLNALLGKTWVSPEQARAMVEQAGMSANCRVSTEGGLWIELRR